jgi:hypothetical protein
MPHRAHAGYEPLGHAQRYYTILVLLSIYLNRMYCPTEELAEYMHDVRDDPVALCACLELMRVNMPGGSSSETEKAYTHATAVGCTRQVIEAIVRHPHCLQLQTEALCFIIRARGDACQDWIRLHLCVVDVLKVMHAHRSDTVLQTRGQFVLYMLLE